VAEEVPKLRASIDLDREMERIQVEGARIVTLEDESYPVLLRKIEDPPPLLYVKGTLTSQDEWSVAVVGTRRASTYGREAASLIAGGLARSGITVVSGLARGIDSQAHRAALDSGGRTIAVLGCGIDVVYPPENVKLAQQVVRNGALVTEFALGTRPDARNFPPRNRIISGMTLGAVVVEAGQRSGANITAGYAAEQGREVFAVPGRITSPGSRGTNRLILDGASPVVEVKDVLEALNLQMVGHHEAARDVVPDTEMEARILQYLSSDPVHLDDVGRQIGAPIHEISSALAMMELKGMVRQVGGMTYVVARERGVGYIVE
jgi:DNA processing protein